MPIASPAGQGPAKTRLVFPKPLSEILGNGTSYTYGPAYIQFNGANWLNAQTFLASVTAVSSCMCAYMTIVQDNSFASAMVYTKACRPSGVCLGVLARSKRD